MIRKIVSAQDPILRQKAKAVTCFDKKLVALAKDLEDTLGHQMEPEGVGLAGPQIGKSLRIFAALIGKEIRLFVNPKIIKKIHKRPAKAKVKASDVLEGCLSILHYYGSLNRSYGVTLSFQDLKGQQHTEKFWGLDAQIIQHEVDHLNGILFTDHILTQKQKLFKVDPKTNQWEEVELV